MSDVRVKAAVLLDTPEGLRFVDAQVVRRIFARPATTAIPSSRVGLSLLLGRTALTLDLGSGPHALLCDVEGDAIALGGLRVDRVGFFDELGDGICVDGENVLPFDVAAKVASFLRPEDAQ